MSRHRSRASREEMVDTADSSPDNSDTAGNDVDAWRRETELQDRQQREEDERVLRARMFQQESSKDVYDPEQDLAERREVRKSYRALQKNLDESKDEFIKPNSKGLYETYNSANKLYKNVKQTADATLDSRLLVAASDLALKKVTMAVGSSAVGIDVDEFVGKCFSFMRRGGRDRDDRHEEDDGEDHGDASDWAYLGRASAHKGNKRPPTIDFLLGPLSVQKKARVTRARKEGVLHKPGTQATRPVDMSAKDIQHSETTTLKLVRNVHSLLLDHLSLEPDQDIRLFDVVINPESYGQTIENIFVVSFLVGEGRVATWIDNETGIPMLGVVEQADQVHDSGQSTRQQAIFSLTMYEWKRIIEVYGITKPLIIPTRPKEQVQITSTGWYA